MDDAHSHSKAPAFLRSMINTASFQVLIMIAIVANAMADASIKFEHDGRPREEFYKTLYPIEITFTVIKNDSIMNMF